MFYCDKCREEKGWPETFLFKSVGPCEICNVVSLCHDTPSRLLPVVKTDQTTASLEDLK